MLVTLKIADQSAKQKSPDRRPRHIFTHSNITLLSFVPILWVAHTCAVCHVCVQSAYIAKSPTYAPPREELNKVILKVSSRRWMPREDGQSDSEEMTQTEVRG